MATIGWDQPGNDWQHDVHNGAACNFTYLATTDPTEDGGGQLNGSPFGTWPDPLPAADTSCYLLSVYATTNASHVVTKLTAYVNADDMMGFDVDFSAAIYDADTRALLGASSAVTVSPNGDVGQWVDFTINEGPTLVSGGRYTLVVWCDGLDGLGTVYADNFEDWLPVVRISVSNVVEVASAGVVFEINTTLKTAAGPLFTGGGML